MYKKLFAIIISLILVVSVTGIGTWAFLNDIGLADDNTIAAGSLDLKLDDTDGSEAPILISDVVPGDSGSSVVELKNSGTLAGELSIDFSSIENTASGSGTEYGDDSGDLGDEVLISVYLDINRNGVWDAGDYGLQSDGSVYQYSSGQNLEYDLINSYSDLAYNNILTMNSGDIYDFYILWVVPTTAGNEIQGDSVTFDMHFNLNQVGSGGGTIPLTAIGSVSGTVQVGQTITAGALTPYGATANYRWQRAATAGGTFEDITGATSGSYVLISDDYGYYFKVIAIGTGNYSGTVSSTAVGPAAAGPITGISSIVGTVAVGYTLTAGTVTPLGATVSYQWLSCDTIDGVYVDISGATENTLLLTGSLSQLYIKVAVTGTGGFTGTVDSDPTLGRVTANAPVNITAIDPINGITEVGRTLTAGALTPSGAAATYQWQRSSTADGSYSDIAGAVYSTYTLAAGDFGHYIKVVATGSGSYTGTVTSAYAGPVTYGVITAIGSTSGTTLVGQPLTAGSLTPSGATATYQWLRCDTPGGTYENIPGATSGTYTLTAADLDKYIKVTAIGTGSYTGTVTSAQSGPVGSGSATPVTAIAPIIGTVQVSQTLTAGAVTPSGATVTYQWQRSDTFDGIYEAISGATAATYTLNEDDYNKYIKVVATGSGSYSGSVTSTYSGPVTAGVITGISPIIGTTVAGQTLTAGTVTPLGATVTYQWQRSDTGSGATYENIAEGILKNYIPTGSDSYRYLRVIVTGTGAYTGSVTSDPTASRVVGSSTEITAIGAINGTAQVGSTLNAGALTPSGASATYQWQRAFTAGGSYEIIAGAVYSSYTLSESDYGYYIQVVATGSGAYSGSVTSSAFGPVLAIPLTNIGPISGSTVVGQTLTAGTLTPSGATATYQWQRSATAGGSYTDIPGQTTSTYVLTAADEGYYFRVVATGYGSYSGSVTSTYTGPVSSGSVTPLSSIGPISGTAQVGQTLTAGALSPSGATATYQWQSSATSGGTYLDISGATASSYTLTADDYNKYIKVVATGSGSYSGSVTSAYSGPVSAGVITGISPVIGTTMPGQTLTAGTVTPLGATVTYQWQVSDTNYVPSSYEDIPGATSSTYYIINWQYSYRYVRVVVTGSGAYTGTVISDPTPARIGAGNTAITAIGAISGTPQVGQTLTAGTVSPSGATVTYQWQRGTTSDGTYENIAGATAGSYILVAGDLNYYIRVVVTGSGAYSGILTSAYTGPVAAP